MQGAMIALGYLARAIFAQDSTVDGLAISATNPASMSAIVGPGMITAMSVVEQTAYGVLPANTTDPLMKFGVNTYPTTLTFAAPGTPGQSIAYLVYAAFNETDTSALVLPYFNAADPTNPFTGPSNSATAQNTIRDQKVTVSMLAGAPATTGTQSAPATPNGAVPLYVVTVPYGATTLTSSNFAVAGGAPFIPTKLGSGMNPGFSRSATYGTAGSSTFIVPAGCSKIRIRCVGAGGGGGGANSGTASGTGGGGGGYAEGIYGVTPGQVLAVTVGAAGTAGASGGGNGGAGGSSSVGSLCSATGGGAGIGSTGGVQGSTGAGGNGVGGTILNVSGISGTAGFISGNTSLYMGGAGGRAYTFDQISGAVASTGAAGQMPGSGGGGASVNGAGGVGFAGLVIIEY